MPLVPKYKNVYVVSPANLVTGGPESLHQLAYAIRQRGGSATMSYYPRGTDAAIPEPYRDYELEAADPVDEPSNLVVIPESGAGIMWEFKMAVPAIWWLSVDNFYGPRPESDLEFRHLVGIHAANPTYDKVTGRPSWTEIRKVLNFSQSMYASSYLADRDVPSVMLETPLNNAFFDPPALAMRRDLIAFNPKKGAAVVERLNKRLPDLAWLPLTGLTRQGVRDALSTVKLYADFGFHPGRERIPREAAMCGACVLTGTRGSAAFNADVPIPDRYKLNEQGACFEVLFARIVGSIFGNFEQHARRFDPYRQFIVSLGERFAQQVESAFFHRV